MSGSLVSALRRERNLLRQEEHLYRAIAENSRDAVILVDRAGAIVWANRAAEHTFGKSLRPGRNSGFGTPAQRVVGGRIEGGKRVRSAA